MARIPACDLVLSSSSAFVKGIRVPAGATHVSYIHSPMRFAWSLDDYIAREQLPPAVHHALRPLMAAFRMRDRATAQKPNRLIANSTVVRDRIRAWWRRDAVVINPPVETQRFQPVAPSSVGDAFLIVTRLVPYKRLDLVIEACNALGLPLQIIGDGRDRVRLERMSGPTVRFLGRLSDDEVAHHYATARATIFMSEDDFGIAQVEAQAAGRPVIALRAGGACDTVIDGETGVHVPQQTTADLIAALQRFDGMTFSTDRLVQHAATFGRARFERELLNVVEETMDAVRNGTPYAWN
jgi:glycosyltransferase involved in cell wall biosynthesis